ncbi:MAG TPA: T9SS type A sorting domain-containing protein [Ferruginibacter sp.]|nr:T9SS type A sorting domain-containing protein [Ferruginibacter sp.]
MTSSVPSQEICTGTNVTFTATPTNEGTNYGFAWFLNDVLVATTGTTPTWSTTGLNNGDEVKVRLSSNISCGYNNPAFSDSMIFVVNPLQPVSVSVTSSDIDNIICAGQSVTFTATPTNGGSNPQYQWMVNSGDIPGENGTTFTTTTLNNGDIVQVRLLSDITPCATGNPAVSTGINMTVNPLLVPAVSITANPGVDICSGTNVTFTATPTNGGGTPAYQWYLNGAPVGTNSPTYSNSTLGDLDEVYVVMTTSEACFTTPTATSNTLIINLTGALPVSVVLSTPQTSVCGTPNVTFTATPTNGGTIPNYEFFVNSVSVQNGTSATYTYVPANGDDVEVILTSDLACATGNPATSNLITMTVNPTPAAPTISAGGPTTFCAGGSVTLTSSVPTGNTWSPGGETTASINVTTSGSYTVIQTVAGCPSAPSAPVVVTVNPIPPTPTINVTGGSAPYCSGTNYTLTSSAASGNTWSPGGQTTVSINTSVAGTYTVTQTLLGCPSLPSAPVVINASPTVNISGSNDYCGTPVLLTANAVAGSGTITTYQWFQGATPVGTNSNTYSANANGSYTVVVTNSNGCSITSAPHVLGLPTGPLNGVYTVSAAPLSCTNFPSIKDAINALNTRSISGNVTFNVAAGFVEPATGGKLVLGNTTLNAAVNAGPYNIIFQKNGVGANPVINAYTGIAPNSNNANPDGIWAIAGTDNVTIDGIDLADANGTTTTQMEFGYGLFKLNNNDGVQNVTIQNCNISLTTNNAGSGTSLMPEGSTGILVLNATPTAATTVLVPTLASGTNSNNKFYGNTIRQVNNGIVLIGYVAPSPYTLGDNNNDVGGSALATGNTIENFGGGGALAAVGIEAANQWNLNISYNTINNNTGAHVNHGGQLRGILCNAPGTPSAYLGYSENSNVDITYNTVTVKNNAAQPVVGIENGIGGSGNTAAPSVGNVVNITHNSIVNSGNTPSLGNVFYGIFHYASAERTNINNNHINGVESYGAANSYMMYINPTPSPVVNSGVDVYVEDNLIENVTKTSTAAGSLRGILTQNRINNFYVLRNTIQDFEFNSATTGTNLDGIYSLGSAQMVYIHDNIVRDILKSGAGNSTIQAIRNNDVNGVGFVKSFLNNQVYNITTGVDGVHNIFGIYSGQGENNTLAGNQVYGIINNSTAAGGSVTGIAAANLAVNHFISKNRVYNLSAQGPSPVVTGILTSAALSSHISNNFVSDLRAPLANSADAVRGISYTSTTANSTHGLYYNTIYLNATSTGTNFGTSGVFHTSSTTVTTSVLDMRNNIVVNMSIPNGTGVTAALRRSSATLNNFSASSNYNLLFAGTPTANNVVYFNGTAVQTLAAYQAAVTPRDAASISVMPTFVNIAAAPFNLRLDQNQNCGISKLGNNNGILLADDFDGESRAVIAPFLTDIGADEFISLGGTPFTWKGVNTNWEDPANWCTGVPQSTHNVIIPTGMANYPVLTTNTNVAGSVTIQNGASVTINSGAALAVHGANFTINGTLANNGSIRFNGTAAQTFGSGTGTITAMHTLEMNNTTSLSVDKNLAVTGALLPNAGTITLNNINITLVSSATATASVGQIGNLPGFTYNGTGKFIVENYIASGGNNEGWRFLSIPTNTTQTINQAWMEGQAPANYTPTGYGMQIVGPAAAGAGFDVNTPTTSLKTFSSSTNTWVTVPGTTGAIASDMGYMAFIRGDRGSNTFGSSSNTILRTEGPIKVDELVVNHAANNEFVSVGNPFPSAVSFAGFNRTNIGSFFYLWDPKLGTYGGYQTFTQAGPIYVPTPGGGSYTSGNYYIESGQAFLVRTTGATAQLRISEDDKVLGSNPVTRTQNNMAMLSTRIYNMAGAAPHLTDGVMSVFDPVFSNEVDAEDAVKAGNFNESFGIRIGESILSVEMRNLLNDRDTIQYVFGALRANTPYRLELNAERLDAPGMEAWLEDRFLNTFTPVSLSGTTEYDFTIQQAPASYATDRFRVVFKLARPLPVRFTRIDATVDDKDVHVKWEVAEEVNINNYTVQRSVDGRNFTDIASQPATGSQGYMHTDVRPGNGVFYYRIRSNGNGSDIQYSRIVSVILSDAPGTITVYPNPVQDDKLVKVNMTNMPKGRYNVLLINSSGQVVFRRQIDHAGGNMVYDVRLGFYLSHGTYTMQITGNGKSKTSIKIVY